MYVIPDGREATHILHSYESKDILKVLEFRLLCRSTKSTGMIAFGLGRALWIDANGQYMDGAVNEDEARLRELIDQLDRTDLD